MFLCKSVLLLFGSYPEVDFGKRRKINPQYRIVGTRFRLLKCYQP